MKDKPRIIHRDIKSENILLDENLNAKVADFGLSRLHPTVGEKSTILTKNLAGTDVYIDPEYRMTGKYKKESDTYSFGVVLFEVLSGKMAYDSTYMRENDDGLAPIVRRQFNEQKLMQLIDPKMLEEDDEHTFTLNRGPTKDSFNLFTNIGYECLAKTQVERPKLEVVIKKLKEALEVQGETMVLSRFRLSSIEFAIQNFAKTYYLGLDTYGKVYEAVYLAQLDHFESNSLLETKGKNNGEPPKRRIGVVIKRISGREGDHGEEAFFSEIEMHTRYKHPNLVPLLGFCYEGDNMLLVYEHASDESLDKYLRDTDYMTKHTWIQRLHQCLGIAHGLNHLHTLMDRKQEMIHVDIRCANILLGKSGKAKIAYFGFSKLLQGNQEASTDNNIRKKVYCCPEYQKTGELKKQSDIYSFGVVLFEIFCGRLAYDPVYTEKNDNGLAPIARRCFSDGTIKEMIDPVLKEETSSEDILTSNIREPILDSLGTYLRIANQCLAENQAERPTMQIVVKELEIALDIQKNFLKTLQISFKDLESATRNFSQKNCFGSGRYWKAYEGELRHSKAKFASASGGGGTSASASANESVDPSASGSPTARDSNGHKDFIIAKRWDSESNQGDHQFRTELSIIIKRKHENIIGLVGYCHEMDERIIVYEQASKGSLDMYLNDATLTWMKRLKICTDVARALEFLHGGDGMLNKVVHRNIQCSAILLNDDWKAKFSNLEMASLDSLQQDMEHVSNNDYDAFGYLDPEYKQGYLTEKSDIYSFGVVMFEVLCGRLKLLEGFKDHSKPLGPLAKRHYEEGKLDEMVFQGIKEEIGSESLVLYADIAYQCLHDIREKRPTASEVVLQLNKVLDLQGLEDFNALDNTIFVNKGQPLGGKTQRKGKLFTLDALLSEQAHRYVLFNSNCDMVEEYIKEHQVYIDSQPQKSRWTRAQNHSNQFPDWLRDKAINSTVPNHIFWLAKGPSPTCKRYQGYYVNGYMYHTKANDLRCKTRNSGVSVTASSFASSRDKNPVDGNVDYYGRILEIIELNYSSKFNVVLFRCEWYQVQKYDYVLPCVNLNKLCCSYDPFVMPNQVHQVLYEPDPIDISLHYVMKIDPRDLFDSEEERGENVDESY